ncbi:MAG: TonB-dependent receptor, partial [candidate division WOR-3 bacterium]
MKKNVFLALAAIVAFGSAEPQGRIAGRVLDASTKAPVAGALVSLIGTEFGAVTNEMGDFSIPNLPVGTYAVEASGVGYQSQVKTEVVVVPRRSTELVFNLEPGVIVLPEVTVRPGYFPKAKDAPVSERVFDAEEIRTQTAGNGDIQRVVQALPALVSSGDQDNEVIVRGGNPNENLFLLDGIEIPYPNHFGNFGAQGGAVNMLDALIVRDVAFIAGAFPVRYGDRASSVMDINLRRGSTSEFGGNIDMGMVGLGLMLEGPLPGRLGSFIGTYHKSFLELMAKAGVWGGMTAVPYYDNFLGKIHFRLSPAHELTLLGLYGADHITIEPGQSGYGDSSYHIQYQTAHRALGLSWQTLFGKAGFGRLQLSGVQSNWLEVGTNREASRDTVLALDNSEGLNTLRYDASYAFTAGYESQAGFFLTQVPYSYKFRWNADSVYHYWYNPDGTIARDSFMYAVPRLDIDNSVKSYKTGGYLQQKMGLGTVGQLTLGLRADYFAYTNKFYLSPRIGFSSVPLFGGLVFNAGYGWHRQSPPGFALMYDPAGNHYLESQRSDHYVLGLEYQLAADAKLSVETYQKDMRNGLVGKHLVTPDPYDWSPTMLDNGRAQARGIEFFFQKKFAHNWNGTIAYSLSDSR